MLQPRFILPLVRRQRGFSMIELLVALGILVALTALALPAILLTRRRGIETRVRSDLSLISTALEAYKSDCGDYPRFSTAIEDYNAALATAATPLSSDYPWIDYHKQSSGGSDRGAMLLCRALIGPGPGVNSAAPTTELQGEDGADGPGFRIRRNISTINGIPTNTGKTYGPYLDASKFKLVNFNATYMAANPGTVYDVRYAQIADSSGNPILYYPALISNPAAGVDPYQDPVGYTGPTAFPYGYPAPKFNAFDNSAYISEADFETIAGGNPIVGSKAVPSGLPYLLWTAGVDGKYGTFNGKTDDIANFDITLTK